MPSWPPIPRGKGSLSTHCNPRRGTHGRGNEAGGPRGQGGRIESHRSTARGVSERVLIYAFQLLIVVV